MQDQIRGAGGSEEGQGVTDPALQRRTMRSGLPVASTARRYKSVFDVQIGAAGEHREGLVGRVAAEVRAQVHGMPGGFQEPEIGPVGVVYQQQGPVGVADLRQGLQIRKVSQIVRAGQIDRRGVGFGQGPVQGLRRHIRGEIGACRRRQPANLQIQQGSRGEEGLVDVPGRQDAKATRSCHCEASAHTGRGNPFSPRFGPLFPAVPCSQFPVPLARFACQQEHRSDAVGGALGGIEGGAAEEGRGIGLALGYDPGGFIQRISPGDLGDIQFFAAQRPPPLVARHVEPGGAEVTVTGYEIMDWCVHRVNN